MVGRSRTRRRKAPPFRAWGSLLTALLLYAIYEQLWRASLWTFAILMFYVSVVRISRCRVETLQHRPCRWRVRGFFRTCDFHTGMKRGLPSLYQSPGAGLALPMLIWRRPDLAVTFDRVDPQPSPTATDDAVFAPRDRRLGGYTPEFWVGVIGVLIAFAALVRDLIYGEPGTRRGTSPTTSARRSACDGSSRRLRAVSSPAVVLAELTQLPASAANATLTFLGIISPRRRLRAEITADKELQKLFDKDSDAYRLLDERTTFDVALLTEHIIPADKKKTNWSTALFGAAMLLGFSWWTWRLHEAHSAWQWLTGVAAFLGFAAMMGSRTPVQPPAGTGTPDEPASTPEAGSGSTEEPPADDGPTPLAPRRAS